MSNGDYHLLQEHDKRIAQLTQERDEARKEYKAVRGLLDNQCRATSKAAKERDEARKDTALLDWLEEHDAFTVSPLCSPPENTPAHSHRIRFGYIRGVNEYDGNGVRAVIYAAMEGGAE